MRRHDATHGHQRRLLTAIALAVVAAACAANADTTGLTTRDGGNSEGTDFEGGSLVVQLSPPAVEQLPSLDPTADPKTQLGVLRSRYFPVWTSDFDWAFPPTTCNSAWELDGIATVVPGVDMAQYGEAPTMAALAVMRYEHQVSRSLAEPSPLAQLCIAVGSVDVARERAMQALKSRLDGDVRGEAPVGVPGEITILAASPSSMLAVACVAPDLQQWPSRIDDRQVGSREARLTAYLLKIAQGREDRVVDLSYRVSSVEERMAADCSGLPAWVAAWEQRVAAWIDAGQIWAPVNAAFSAADVCVESAPSTPHECPTDWLR